MNYACSASAILAVLFAAACSGGGSSSVTTPPPPAKTVAVRLTILIPARQPSAAGRAPRFVSPGTQSGGIALGQFSTTPTQSFDLSPSSPNCTSGAGGRTCQVSVNLPLGNDSINLFTYDGPLVGGQVSGHGLATASATQTIVEGQLNTVTISLLGVPAAVTLVPQQSKISALGQPVTVPLAVTVYDASANQITGSDPFAQPITLTAGLASMAPASLAFTVNGVSGATMTRPGDTIALAYSGSGGTGDYALNAWISGSVSPIGYTAPFTVQPGFVFVKQVGSNLTNADIEQRYDTRDIWLTEPAAHKIASITSAGLVEYPVASGKEPRHIVFTGLIANGGGSVAMITELPDTIGVVAPNGAISERTVPTANAGLGGVAYDYANFRLWFAESAGSIGTTGTSGAITEYPVGIGGSAPAAVTLNFNSGGIWFTDPGMNAIGWMKPDHSVVEYPIPTQNAGPSVITSGSGDVVWFGESNAAKLGHIDTSGRISEYPVPDVIVSLFTAAQDGSYTALWALTRSGTLLRVGANGTYQTMPSVPVGNGAPIVIAQGYSSNILVLRSGLSVSDLDEMFY